MIYYFLYQKLTIELIINKMLVFVWDQLGKQYTMEVNEDDTKIINTIYQLEISWRSVYIRQQQLRSSQIVFVKAVFSVILTLLNSRLHRIDCKFLMQKLLTCINLSVLLQLKVRHWVCFCFKLVISILKSNYIQ